MLYSATFAALAAINFFTITSCGMYYLFPVYVTKHGGDAIDVGLTMGVCALSSVICRPWIAQMVDSFGRKRSYAVGSLGMILLPLAYFALPGDLHTAYAPLLIARFLHGAAYATCITAGLAYIADLVPADRLNEGFGMFGVSGLVGSAVGPAVGEWILWKYDFDVFFLVSGGIAALCLCILWRLRDAFTPCKTGGPAKGFLLLIRTKDLSAIALTALLFGFGVAATNGFVSPLVNMRNSGWISAFYICYAGSAICTRLVGGRLADRLGEGRIIPFALTVTSLGLAAIILPGGVGIMFLSGVMTGCGHGILYPALTAMAVRGEPSEVRGKLTGITSGSIDAGMFAGSLLLGSVGSAWGYEAVFPVAAVVVLFGLWSCRGGPRGGSRAV